MDQTDLFLPLALVKVLILNTHKFVNIHVIFRVDPMHNYLLGMESLVIE